MEKACIDLLRLRGYWVVRLHAGTFKSVDGRRWIKGVERGTPDYATEHSTFPGFLLEVKRPGEGPTPEQTTKHFELRMGFRLAIGVIDSVEALNAWLDHHEKRAVQSWREYVTSNPAL